MRSIAALCFAFFLAVVSAPASAQPPLLTGLGGPRDFGTSCLSHNDDGSSAPVDLTPAFPGGLRFFTDTYTSIFVNTNGNVTFGAELPTYTPDAFPIADQPMIAPYWADVDIRNMGGVCMGDAGTSEPGDGTCENPTDNGVWWYLEPGMMVVTWHQVGYFGCRVDKRMNFQLILTTPTEECAGDGDFDVEFRYNRCEWHTGEASGGVDGLCPDPPDPFDTCTPAQAGFDAGNGVDFVEIMGSRTETIHTTLCTMSNVEENGVWRFRIRSGSIICPEAGEPCDTGRVGACAEGALQCVAAGLACVPLVLASDERCDAIDNDCDGMVDEEDMGALCAALEICDRGVCTPGCFEGGCAAGQVCTEGGQCVDEGCETLTCDEGERCMDGACVDACGGVVCPGTQSCRGGRCLDLCATISCDDCTACVGGACEPRCDEDSCPAGQACTPDGRCVDAACVDVTCGAGETCVSGSCQDACVGAVCPSGETCEAGACVPPTPIMPPDGGPARDGGFGPVDGGTIPCPPGADCTGGDDGGCGCSVPQSRGGAVPLAVVSIVALAFFGARRRKR